MNSLFDRKKVPESRILTHKQQTLCLLLVWRFPYRHADYTNELPSSQHIATLINLQLQISLCWRPQLLLTGTTEPVHLNATQRGNKHLSTGEWMMSLSDGQVSRLCLWMEVSLKSLCTVTKEGSTLKQLFLEWSLVQHEVFSSVCNYESEDEVGLSPRPQTWVCYSELSGFMIQMNLIWNIVTDLLHLHQ